MLNHLPKDCFVGYPVNVVLLQMDRKENAV